MTTQTNTNEVYIGRFLLAAVYSNPWLGVNIRVGDGETHADVWATGSRDAIKALQRFAPTKWDEAKFADLDVPECYGCKAKRNLYPVIVRGLFLCGPCKKDFFSYMTENEELAG